MQQRKSRTESFKKDAVRRAMARRSKTYRRCARGEDMLRLKSYRVT